MARRWAELEAAPPEREIYEEKLAELWRGIGCAADGAPFVLTGLLRIMSMSTSSSSAALAESSYAISPFADHSVQVPKLAADFLKEDCAGARGISEHTRAMLMKLRDAAPQELAKPNTQPAKP